MFYMLCPQLNSSSSFYAAELLMSPTILKLQKPKLTQ